MKLTDKMIVDVALAVPEPRTVRAVQKALRTRYGSVGKTRRVMALLRQSKAEPSKERSDRVTVPAIDDYDLLGQLRDAEERAAQAQERAALAEHREQVHQDLRAEEIYDLRQELATLRRDRLQQRSHADQFIELHRQLARARTIIGTYEQALKERGVDRPEQLLPSD